MMVAAKTLRLVSKKKWFDMVFLGIKPEEYRAISKHYLPRMLVSEVSKYIIHEANILGISYEEYLISYVYDCYNECQMTLDSILRDYDQIEIVNGYQTDSDWFTIQLKKIAIRTGHQKWGAELDQNYFVLEMGNVLSYSIKDEILCAKYSAQKSALS